ncbi:MAG TPA: serine hydrolase [Chthoniobacterales bacterium]|nr:serine hydrolase [Chthoniobacterales bacterium]
MKLVRVNVRLPGVNMRTVVSSPTPAFHAYHGVTNAEHQAHIDRCFLQGYRMISLSVYGDPDRPLYAAVWVRRDGPAWQAIHGVDAIGYQSFFDVWTARGYVPVLISATGPSNNAVFAAVFEHDINGPWQARCGMASGAPGSAGTFENENAKAADRRLILHSVAVYGSRGDRRYAAVWHSNPLNVKWHLHSSESAAHYQMVFDAETKLPGYDLAAYRPALVAVSGDLAYCSLFKDDTVGPWVMRNGMTETEYQAELDHQVANGFYPICVQGGASTVKPIYAAIFATQDVPLSREWIVAGEAVSELTELDQIMQRFMQVNGVRAAQLAVGRDGIIIFSRAYTWAEPGYRITESFTRFLLAGCSKIFLEAAVQSLYDDNKLKPTTAVYPLLGFSDPLDTRSDSITIQQLLNNSAGYDEVRTGFNPTFNMRSIALELGLTHPVTKLDVARYMYGRALDFSPGTDQKESDYAYLLAGVVVEHITGETYIDYLNERLLTPVGFSKVKVVSTSLSGRTSDDAIVEDQGFGLSPIDLRSRSPVPCVYGGNGQINEVGDANYGIGAAAETLAGFIHRHAVWGNGPRATGCSRRGDGPGSSCLASSRNDGIDWAFTINTRDWPPSTSVTLRDLENSINELLDRVTND